MSKYQVKFYTGNYGKRQKAANRDNAICYVEQHFNAAVDPETNYALVIVGKNASQTSMRWGDWLADEYSSRLNITKYGVSVGGFDGRGNGNIVKTNMPAVLLEPLFCSSYDGAAVLKSYHGQKTLAKVIVDSIQKFFPDGGLVAFSIGHKGKTSKPHDRGALVLAGGTEAEYAEIVLTLAEKMLTGVDDDPILDADDFAYLSELKERGLTTDQLVEAYEQT